MGVRVLGREHWPGTLPTRGGSKGPQWHIRCNIQEVNKDVSDQTVHTCTPRHRGPWAQKRPASICSVAATAHSCTPRPPPPSNRQIVHNWARWRLWRCRWLRGWRPSTTANACRNRRAPQKVCVQSERVAAVPVQAAMLTARFAFDLCLRWRALRLLLLLLALRMA